MTDESQALSAEAQKRVAALREVMRAANDWHDATALYSVQDDLDWLLARAEDWFAERAARPPDGLREADALVDGGVFDYTFTPEQTALIAAFRATLEAAPPATRASAGLDDLRALSVAATSGHWRISEGGMSRVIVVRYALLRCREAGGGGRHCRCSACARQDWTDPTLAPCGMHGPSCPPVYAPAP